MIRSPAGFDGADRIKRYLDYYQPSYGVMMLSAGQFSPALLFAQGEQGVWYDPSDMTTLFQDAAGTTPVTAVEQPVGLMLDKSKGLVLGSELVTNGTFDSNVTGWTINAANRGTAIASAGRAVLTNDYSLGSTLGFTAIIQGISTQVGSFYKYSANCGGTAGISATNNSNGTSAFAQVTGAGDKQLIFLASAATTYIVLYVAAGADAATANFDNISVRELPGNHASQSTSASRPVLSARVNLLTRTEEFDNAAWGKELSPIITPNSSTAPNGTLTADEYSPTQSTSRVTQASAVLSGQPYTFSIYAKAVTNSVLSVEPAVIAGFSLTFFNLATGTVTSGQAGSTIVSVGSGWYRCSIPFTPSTSGNMTFRVGSYYNTSGSILIWGADLRPANAGVNLPVYQRVVTATNYDTTGFPMYLRFDGTDDSMATGTINPGAVDKAQVFAGVRKLSDAALGIVAETSISSTSNAGTIYLIMGTGLPDYYAFRSGGTTRINASATSAQLAAPITNVLTGLGDISGDLATIRVNGTQAGQNTADQGTGNYLSYPLYIGSRGGSSLRFNGHLYSLVVRFSATNLPDATIAQTETWVNGKTGAY